MALSRFVLPYADIGSGVKPPDGAKLYFKATGTSTDKDTFSDSAGTTPNANPVVANASGVFGDIFWSGIYKVTLTDKNDVQIWEADPVTSFDLPGGDVKSFDTLALAVANTGLINGDSINLKERATGSGGGAIWDVVLASGVTTNTFNIVQCVGVATLALVLVPGDTIYASQFGASGDGSTDDVLAIQAALDYANSNSVATNKSKVVLTPGRRYITTAALNIPANIKFDTSGTEVFCSAVTLFNFGNGSTLIGHNAEYTSSGAAGSAIRRLDQATSSGMNIFGWPQLTATTQRTTGSIGVDGLGSFRANLQVYVIGYDIGIRVGGAATPNSYYANLEHPSAIACNTGIFMGQRSNGWTITHPQVSGSNLYRFGIHAKDCVNGVITGGYVEAFEDNVNSRGLLFDGATGITVVGTAVEATSTVANFAIGMINNANDLIFVNCKPGSAWNSGGKLITNSGTGQFSWRGLNPFTGQQIDLLAVRTFVGDETQGMYKASSDLAGTSNSARTQYFKVGTAIGNGQMLGAIEAKHEDATDPGITGRVSFVTDGGTSGDTAIVFENGNATSFAEVWRMSSTSGNLTPGTDAGPNLGSASLRVKEVFASVGTINTSDRNEKDLITAIEEAETQVAVKIKAGLKKFKFKDAIASKGDSARTHFGVIAQEVFDCFASEGLDARDYACYCSDTWYEAKVPVVVDVANKGKDNEETIIEDKNMHFDSVDEIPDNAISYYEKTRLGIRPDQLLFFMMSAL